MRPAAELAIDSILCLVSIPIAIFIDPFIGAIIFILLSPSLEDVLRLKIRDADIEIQG